MGDDERTEILIALARIEEHEKNSGQQLGELRADVKSMGAVCPAHGQRISALEQRVFRRNGGGEYTSGAPDTVDAKRGKFSGPMAIAAYIILGALAGVATILQIVIK